MYKPIESIQLENLACKITQRFSSAQSLHFIVNKNNSHTFEQSISDDESSSKNKIT